MTDDASPEYAPWELQAEPPSWVVATPAQVEAIRCSAAGLVPPAVVFEVWPVGDERCVVLNGGGEIETWSEGETALAAIDRLLRKAHHRDQLRKKQDER